MNKSICFSISLWPGDPVFSYLLQISCVCWTRCTGFHPYPRGKLAVLFASHPGIQKTNNLKDGNGDGNHVSIHSKCKSLEALRDSFGCCSPPKGLQIPADLNSLLPLSQVCLSECFTYPGRYLCLWGTVQLQAPSCSAQMLPLQHQTNSGWQNSSPLPPLMVSSFDMAWKPWPANGSSPPPNP